MKLKRLLKIVFVPSRFQNSFEKCVAIYKNLRLKIKNGIARVKRLGTLDFWTSLPRRGWESVKGFGFNTLRFFGHWGYGVGSSIWREFKGWMLFVASPIRLVIKIYNIPRYWRARGTGASSDAFEAARAQGRLQRLVARERDPAMRRRLEQQLASQRQIIARERREFELLQEAENELLNSGSRRGD